MAYDFKKIIIRNTSVNYLVMLWQLVTVLFTTRIIYLGLGEELYGFWTLIWSIFGYAVLLDFGFGTSVRKYTAEVVINRDFKKFNEYISTIILCYTLMALIVIAVSLIMAFNLSHIFKFNDNAIINYAKVVFLILGIGISITFPTGIFPEMLMGLQRADMRNYIMFMLYTVNLLGIYIIFKLGYSILTLAVFSVTLNILCNLFMFALIKMKLRGFKFSFFLARASSVREIAKFSSFAYIYSLAELIIVRTDKVVLAVLIGMDSVAIYQLGTRISDLMLSLVTQFQDNLPAIAASINAENDKERLKWVLIRTSRLTAFISTGSYITLMLMVKPVLLVWLKVTALEPAIIAYIMLTSTYIIVLFKNGQVRFMQMAGKHKIAAYINLIESISNIVLSIILVKIFGTVGVAYGTLIPTFIVTVFIIYPLFVKFTETSFIYIFKKVYLKLIFAAIPALIFLYYTVKNISENDWNVLLLFVILLCGGGVFTISCYFIYFTKEEKERYLYSSLAQIKNKFLG